MLYYFSLVPEPMSRSRPTRALRPRRGDIWVQTLVTLGTEMILLLHLPSYSGNYHKTSTSVVKNYFHHKKIISYINFIIKIPTEYK